MDILLMIVLTAAFYMFYPWLCVVAFKKQFTKEEAKKMALWNSIIVGCICFIVTALLYDPTAWNIMPALLYYYINSFIWVKKDKDNSSEMSLKIKKFSTKKKKVEEQLDDSKSDAQHDMDQKYDDLVKLKDLLDKKIITQEEFEKEKKKILK